MAAGKQTIIIDSDELVKGMTTSDNLTDGGFSPYSEGINIAANPGVIYPSPATQYIGDLDGRVVSSCYDTINSSTAAYTVDKYLTTSNGHLWMVKNGSLSDLGSLGSSSNFFAGAVDSIQYDRDGSQYPLVYISNSTDIARVSVNTNTFVATITTNWFSTVSGSPGSFISTVPHPMLVFNKVLFIADGWRLHTWDGTTFTSSVLTLKVGEIIQALSIDPGSGRMLISIASRGATSAFGSFTSSVPSQSFIGYYDGINPTQLLRKVPIDDTVVTFVPCAGVMNVIYGDNLGYFDGNGLHFIRKLNIYYGQIEQAGNSYTVFKHKVCNIQNFLCIALCSANIKNPFTTYTSDKIMVYGEVSGDKKSFFNVYAKSDYSLVDFVTNYKDTSVMFSSYDVSNSKYKLFYLPFLNGYFNGGGTNGLYNVLSTGDNSPMLLSKRLAFSRPSIVNQIRVFFEDSVAADGSTVGTLSCVDDQLTIASSLTISNPSTGSATKWFDMFPDVLTTQCQVLFQWTETTKMHGIQKIMVFYTPYE